MNNTNNTPAQKMQALLSGMTTEALYDLIRNLNLATETHEILLCVKAETELSTRITEAELVQFMNELDAELDAA